LSVISAAPLKLWKKKLKKNCQKKKWLEKKLKKKNAKNKLTKKKKNELYFYLFWENNIKDSPDFLIKIKIFFKPNLKKKFFFLNEK
jgi:hypothetical protein